MKKQTTKQKIIELIKEKPTKVGVLSSHIGVSENEVIKHIQDITNYKNYKVLAKPPKCRNCGFSNFKNIKSPPTKCPDCYSTALIDMKYKIVEKSI